MGNLVPGATYVYEKADGVTYARIAGSDPKTRTPIGWDLERNMQQTNTIFGAPMEIIAEMVEVYEAAKSNPALQQALDQVIMLHKLSKEYERQT